MFKFLLDHRMIRTCEKSDFFVFYKAAYVIGEAIRLVNKGLKAITKGDFKRFTAYFKRLRIKDPVVSGRKA